MSIKRLILAVIMVVLMFAASFILIFLNTTRLHQDAQNVKDQFHHLQLQFSSIESVTQKFLISNDRLLLNEYLARRTEIKKSLQQLLDHADLSIMHQKLLTLEQDFFALEATFNELSSTKNDIGLTNQQGLKAQLSQKLAELTVNLAIANGAIFDRQMSILVQHKQDFLLNYQKRSITLFQQEIIQFKQLINVYVENQTDATEALALIDSINSDFEELSALYLSLGLGEDDGLLQLIQRQIRNLQSANKVLKGEVNKWSQDKFESSNQQMLLIFIFLVALLLIPLLLILKRLSKMILNVSKTVQEISLNKDFSLRVAQTGNDEMSDTLNKINELLQIVEESHHQSDLAHQKILEAETISSLGKLAAGMAHQINTPLGIIITSSSMLKEFKNEVSERLQSHKLNEDDLTKFLENMEHALSLIDSSNNSIKYLVANFNKASQLQHMTDTINIEFSLLANMTFKDLQEKHHLTPARLVNDLNDKPSFFGNYAIIQEVIFQIIDNCFSHSDKQTELVITLEGEIDDSQVDLYIKDNGTPLSDEQLMKIFQPFYTDKMGQHYGLGMYSVFSLVRYKLLGKVDIYNDQGVVVHLQFNPTDMVINDEK